MRRVLMILALLVVGCNLVYGRNSNSRRANKRNASVAPAEVTVNPESLDFGDQVIGRISRTQRITVTSTGTGKLYVNSTALAGDDWQQFRVTLDTCTGATVAPQKSCVIDVVCIPARRGSLKTVLTITDNAIGSHQRVELAGNGINSADVPPFP